MNAGGAVRIETAPEPMLAGGTSTNRWWEPAAA
jgi:hypothetical protein